jgi:hypothetical protein
MAELEQTESLLVTRFDLSVTFEANIMAHRIAAFVLERISSGERIIIRNKKGEEAEFVIEPTSDTADAKTHGQWNQTEEIQRLQADI